jgi:hypothetical protein
MDEILTIIAGQQCDHCREEILHFEPETLKRSPRGAGIADSRCPKCGHVTEVLLR